MKLPKPDRRQALAALAGSMLLPQAAHATPLLRESRVLFGSPCELLVAGDVSPAVLAPVWAGLAGFNSRWNAWKPEGLGPLNLALREGRRVTVSPALRQLIAGATRLEALSGGHFNPAIGGLVQAWGFHDDELRPGARPSSRSLQRWLEARPSLRHLHWNGFELSSRHQHLQLDFGAYAKGVAVDWALDRLQAAGVAGAVVNLGGNLSTLGGAAGRPWQVGVRDPAGPGLVAQLATRGREAVVTSGSYERVRLLDGQACCHLIDPVSGQPAAELVSTTVVHADAALADAAATALLVAGPRRWGRVAQDMGLSQVLVVHASGLVEATAALAPRLQLSPRWRRALHVV